MRTAKFVVTRELAAADTGQRWRPVAAADFNGDGWDDVFRAEAMTGNSPTVASLWLNRASNDASGYPRFDVAYSAMATAGDLTQMGSQSAGGTSVQPLDVNGDRKIDLVIGSGNNGGSVKIFLNTCTLAAGITNPPPAPAPLRCANRPTFAYSSTLINSLGITLHGNSLQTVFAYGDVDGDGRRDLVASGPDCCSDARMNLRLWRGVDGGGLAATPTSITFAGGASAVVLADMSGDGRLDLMVGSDSSGSHPGNILYWPNSGTSTPFGGTPTQVTSPKLRPHCGLRIWYGSIQHLNLHTETRA